MTSWKLRRSSSRRNCSRRAAPRRGAISPTAQLSPPSRRISASAMRRMTARRCAAIWRARASTVEQMAEAGLVITGDDIPVAYDRFRDRVMFPIRDPRGKVIAFGGRALSKDVPAKYLNSPETPLFHKGAGALQSRQGARARPRDRRHHRGRRLYRRDRHAPGGLPHDGGAARHGADRGPAGASLADRAGTDPLFRWR